VSQTNFFQLTAQTVGEITQYLRTLLESDELLQDLWIQGEVSNFQRASSGHCYFTLKDSQASLRCVMWRTSVQRQAASYLPVDGEAVLAHGSISIYPQNGQYQLYVDLIQPLGEGRLYQEFLRLKATLEAEGLFDLERKREIPRFPQKIGIVTSPTGAALQDILNTITRRYPVVEVILSPTMVQGEDAPQAIVKALEILNRAAKPDVVIVARGGGSLEDLWAFNTEIVARAIVCSEAPVISGVGHEIDFTIADFAADLRAPTPTAAAELATPDQLELRTTLHDAEQQLNRLFQYVTTSKRIILSGMQSNLKLYSPFNRILSNQQRLDELTHRAQTAIHHRLELERAKITGLTKNLFSLSPNAVLKRGYAILESSEKHLIASIHQVKAGDQFTARLSDGAFDAKVVQSQDVHESFTG
jgi:exodeoxyribonuclease VII large subunit